MNSNYPLVVILILSYNGKELLLESIPSYIANDYPNFKVVIIDNGSQIPLELSIGHRFEEVEILRIEENKGYSGGFNVGIDYAVNVKKADYLLISNDDVVADHKLVSSLIEVTEKNRKVGFVTGKVYYHESNKKTNIIQTVGKYSNKYSIIGGHIGFNELDTGQYDETVERDFVDDVFTLVSKSVVNQVGGYDENFFAIGRSRLAV